MLQTTSTPADDRAPASAPGSPRSVITILLVAAFVVILNETTMNVALSTIMADLGLTERTAQWLTTAFMLTMAVVIPLTGWLLQRLSTRTAFLVAMSVFSVGTLVCALAPGFAALLAGRIVQACGTAVMMPLLMTTIMNLVPPDRRGRTMGNISLVIAVAPATGPTLAGLLLQLGTWRAIFAVVLPIAVAMLLLGLLLLPNTSLRRPAPVDLPSIPLTVLAFGPLVYGLSQIGSPHAVPGEVAVSMGVGMVALLGFVTRQRVLQRDDRALLDLRTFTVGSFTTAVAVMAIGMMALFGSIIMLPLVLQRSFGLPPLQVGLLMLPGGIAMGLLGPLAGRAFDRVGPRRLVVPASLVVLAVLVFFSTMTPSTPWWLVMTGHLLMSSSFAFIFTPLFTVALGSLAPHLYSHGSAVIGTAQQLAGAAGTALFVTVLAMQTDPALYGGASPGAALLAGSRWAFLGAASTWALAIIAALFLRGPTPTQTQTTATLREGTDS